ncbi:MAG: hypothetical protein EPO19_07525 [Betaproteobacteria bacterium]|nr:MAG: hypothetical protein EPO19_07525 [Betaproteobacteria bacterium]
MRQQLQGLEKIGRVNPHVATVVEIRQHLDDAKDFRETGTKRYHLGRGVGENFLSFFSPRSGDWANCP